MKAAVVTEFGTPLKIRDVPTPAPGPGELLVKLETSALCHTDIHAAHGDWPVKPHRPFIPGHEGIGRVETVGAGVVNRAVGDRVAVPWLGFACGECDYCIGGREELCPRQHDTGYTRNGAFAEYAVVRSAFALPVPGGISPVEAAPLTCAGLAAYKAVKLARVAPTERVAVFGIGGVGHLALQYARLAGAFTVAVDVKDSKLAMAKELDADHLVNAVRAEPDKAIQALGGADVAIAAAAAPEAFQQAYHSLRRGGRLVCIGLPAHASLSIPIHDTVFNGITVLGTISGTRNDLAEVFTLHASGRTRVIAMERKLDEVNAAIGELLAGDVPGRIVFQF